MYSKDETPIRTAKIAAEVIHRNRTDKLKKLHSKFSLKQNSNQLDTAHEQFINTRHSNDLFAAKNI